MSRPEGVRVTWAGGWLDAAARRWWSGEFGLAGSLLRTLMLPFELAFRASVRARNRAYDGGLLRSRRARVPVISVGNLSVGGAGKTPFSAWLVDELVRRGGRPALVHGGYGADEPALHRRWHPEVPVYEERDRVAAAQRAAQDGASVVVLDDGFQHRRLERDLDIVLVAAEGWTPRPHLLPNGPWRETPSALRRADLVVVTRRATDAGSADRVMADVRRFDRPLALAAIQPDHWSLAGRPAPPPARASFAVTAIASPHLFATSVHNAGARIDALLAFPDHHAYTAADLERVRREAAGRPIVTTAKDAIKMAPLIADTDVWVLEQAVRIEAGGERVARALDGVLA